MARQMVNEGAASGQKFKSTFDKFDREGGKTWQAV